MKRARKSAPPLEVEAKFLVRNLADLSRIAAIQRLGPYRLRPRAREQLHSVYFDTAELSLLRERVSLRVRSKRGRFEATAKWMGKVRGAIHERPELTVPLTAAPRRGFTLSAGALHERLCATVAGRKLAPILVTDIERRVIDICAPSGAQAPLAELALDRVRLVAPAPQARELAEYAEVEIELRAGTRTELSAIARRLQQGFGLVASEDSKFGRGLALRFGRPLPKERPKVAPEGSDSVDSAARKVIAGLLSRIREHDPGTRRGDDIEALHQLRVAVRRARAALRVFEAAWTADEGEKLAAELRWLGHKLGAVRDLDVQLDALDAARSAEGSGARRVLDALRGELAAQREGQRALLLTALASRRYFRLLIALERFAHEAPARPASQAARTALAAAGRERIEQTVGKLDKRGRKLARGKHAPSAEQLHALRIRAKRARYALEFMSELTGKPGKRLVKRLVALQDLLGAHQDAVVACALIESYRARHAGDTSAAGPVLADLAAQHGARAAEVRAEYGAALGRWRKCERSELPRLLRQLERSARSVPVPAVKPRRRKP